MNTKKIESIYGRLTFGTLVRSHRESEDLTQAQLAKSIKISRQSLNDIEKCRKIPSISKAVTLAKKIGILPELAVEIALQDLLNRAKLNMTVKIIREK